MKLSKNKTAVAAAIAMLFATALSAEVINLKNGDKLTGKVHTENDTQIVLDTQFGVVTLPKALVESVASDDSELATKTQAAAEKPAAATAAVSSDPTAPAAVSNPPLKEWFDSYKGFLKENLPEGWQFRLRGGLEYTETTAKTFNVNVAFDVRKVWDLEEFAATAYYDYTTQTVQGIESTTTDKYGLDTTFRHNFDDSKHWYFKNILNYKKDLVMGIKDQVDEAATFGYRFDFDRYDLVLDIAPGPAIRYINANNYDQKWALMAVLSEELTWKISDLMRFEQGLYAGINLFNINKYSMSLKLGLVLKATDVMDIALRYSYIYDNINASDAQKTEQRLLLSFEFPFNWVY